MQIKCDYCGSMIEEQNSTCPNCGATLDGVNRFAGGQPRTIEELKAWYVAHNLPPEEVTRFFIGKNITEPKAFGIYQDSTGDFVVYKNKSDGQRAVRYQGADEAYAVNELYQKLKGEIADRKSETGTQRYNEATAVATEKKKSRKRGLFVGVIIFAMIFPMLNMGIVMLISKMAFGIDDLGPSRGYYEYEDDTYYYQDSTWYQYDDVDDDWSVMDDAEVPEAISSDAQGEYQIYSHDGARFEDSIWYTEPTYTDYDDDYDDDWDNDYDWDTGDSWDYNDTDWDTDW